MLLVSVGRSPGQDEEVKRILDKAIQARGGEAQNAKLTRVEIKVKGKAELPGLGMVPMTIEDSWQLPDKYRTSFKVEAMGQTFTQIIILNGSAAWAMANGRSVQLPPEAIAEFREQFHAESLDTLLPLKDKRYTISLLPESKVEDRAVVGIHVKAKGHRDVKLYFDKETGHLLKREHPILADSNKLVVQEIIFGDYKDFGGVKFWNKIRALRDGRLNIEGEVTEIKFPEKFDQKVFGQP
jgi:hypothetical protein